MWKVLSAASLKMNSFLCRLSHLKHREREREVDLVLSLFPQGCNLPRVMSSMFDNRCAS